MRMMKKSMKDNIFTKKKDKKNRETEKKKQKKKHIKKMETKKKTCRRRNHDMINIKKKMKANRRNLYCSEEEYA